MTRNAIAPPGEVVRRAILGPFVLTSLGLLFTFGAQAEPLSFFKSYFVTGDYLVAGAGMKGRGLQEPATRDFILSRKPASLGSLTAYSDSFATGLIALPDAPANADAVAAFLYWESIESTAAPSAFLGTIRHSGSSTAALVIGKPIGDARTAPCWSSGGGTGGANGGPVLRVYRADVLRNLPVVDGRRQFGGTFTVKLPDSGSNGSKLPLTQGVSLLVVYRVRSLAAPLKAVVLYDGSFTLDQANPVFIQNIRGFYDSAAVDGRLTHIVGDGQSNFTEQVSFRGTVVESPNPFEGAAGGAPGGAWDNRTFSVGPLMPGAGDSVATAVSAVPGTSTFDCLSWAAVVFSTSVRDTDNDGLLNAWETAAGFHEVNRDNTNGAFVPLPGANPLRKDIYVQVGYLKAPLVDGDPTKDGHSHLPKLDALLRVYDAFKAAPDRDRPACTVDCGPILHFDVGNHYQTAAHPAIIPAALAQGGQVLEESLCPACDFPSEPGVIGWRTGFQVLRDAAERDSSGPLRAQAGRRLAYRYALFGHALAIPAPKPAGTPQGPPFVPRSVSGVGEYGGDLMVTLGMWRFDDAPGCLKDPAAPNPLNLPLCNDRVGTSLVQAGTFMHELGHNLGLNHGGAEKAPNCKPNYQSVMNYLFQVRGLAGAAGTQVDFSDRALSGLTETSLLDGAGALGTSPAAKYASRWYAPLSALDNTVKGTGNRAARARCDGSPTGGIEMVRIDGLFGEAIDWDGSRLTAVAAQDVNFDGVTGATAFQGYNDWANIDLRQVGARANMLGISGGLIAGDLPDADPVAGSLDLGSLDLGSLDLGSLDLGSLDLGSLDLGSLDLGSLDLGEVDYDLATSVVDAPVNLASAVERFDVRLTWQAPAFGIVRRYGVWRNPDSRGRAQYGLIGTVQAVPGQAGYSFLDTGARNNVLYRYFVTAYDSAGSDANQSGPSNVVLQQR